MMVVMILVFAMRVAVNHCQPLNADDHYIGNYEVKWDDVRVT